MAAPTNQKGQPSEVASKSHLSYSLDLTQRTSITEFLAFYLHVSA
jgi:hypothetical protein